jgi:1,2-dihydroxy-3-keto-5-methylthiopentene dioxygenase
MTHLYRPSLDQSLNEFEAIKSYLNQKGVAFTRWNASFALEDSASQEEILKAYEHELKPYMQKNGFKSADVINVHAGTENIEQIRQKFLKEHTHSEDEVRFFVDGEGKFWFHFDDGEIACLTCKAGDFLAVPKGYKHWFDLAPRYHVKAIRIFSNMDGWVAHYTESGIDAQFNPA